MAKEHTMYYTSSIVTHVLKCHRELLKDWIMQEFVIPSIPAEGQGTKALFTFNDIFMAYFFQKLVNRGFKRSLAKKYIEAFRKEYLNNGIIPDIAVFFINTTAYDVSVSTKTMPDLSAFFQDIINIKAIIKEVNYKMEEQQ